ncbi:MAG: SDR family oxidoreductase [Bacteroidota bacterium]
MNILILGATGATGLELVNQALTQGHVVTAFVRDPSKLKIIHEKLTVIKGNVLDKDVLIKPLKGKDAVLSALGVGKSLKSSNLISNAVSLLIPAMNATNIKRLIFLSAFGVGQTFKQASFIQKLIFRTFLKNIYADKSKADEQILGSTLDWTLVYPVVLTNAPARGKYKAAEKLQMKGMPKISRADVADFMLRQLTDDMFLRKTPIVMD